jgi:hypothetical protein
MSDAPGDPAFWFTWLGEEKIPEPIIRPTTRDKPLRYVRDFCFSKEPPFRAFVGSSTVFDGAPRAVYPAAVEDKGKRFGAKSKADETE